MIPVIDLQAIPLPPVIEQVSFDGLFEGYKSRFVATWAALRETYPELPQYDVQMLETDPAVIAGRAWSWLRDYDRARVNDAIKAVLAPFAAGGDLDAIVASQGIVRLVLVPATDTTPAVMESDDRMRLRYYLSFDRPAAGSAAKYLERAYAAWPTCHHAAVLGRDVHGRAGDVEVVMCGPEGRQPTAGEIRAVSDAIHAPGVKAEATAVSVIGARRAVYTAALRLVIREGLSPDLVKSAALGRVTAATVIRTRIGERVPRNLLPGVAAGDGATVIEAIDLAPVEIAADPYTVPVCEGITMTAEVAR